MSYNSELAIVYIDTSTDPDTGVCIYDLQRALGRGENDLGLLCSDQKWENGSLVRANKINEFSIKKPVRSSVVGLMADSDFQAVRYGFGASTIMLTQNPSSAPTGTWVYQPPRGKGNGTGGANEWFRMRDFEGYYGKRAAPILVDYVFARFSSSQTQYGSIDGVTLFNGFADRLWKSGYSLTVEQLLKYPSSGNAYSDKYIAYIVYNNSTNTGVICVTNELISTASTRGYHTFEFCQNDRTVDNVTYPAIGSSILSNDTVGDSLTIIACVSSTHAETGYAYQVKTFSQLAVNTCYSLAFMEGADRDTTTIIRGASIEGTEGEASLTGVTYVGTGSEVIVNGLYCAPFYFDCKAIVDTTGAIGWTTENQNIQVVIEFTFQASAGNGYALCADPTNLNDHDYISDAGGVFTYERLISLRPNQADQTRQLVHNTAYDQDTRDYIWILKSPSASTSTLTINVCVKLKQAGIQDVVLDTDTVTVTYPTNP